MQEIKITISTENAAFQDGSLPFELARILKKMEDDLENYGALRRFYYDINGNQAVRIQED